MKAKMTTNPRVSVHQCIPWVSAQFPNVSEPTSSGRWPQTKLSKYGYFPYKDLNVMYLCGVMLASGRSLGLISTDRREIVRDTLQ